MERLTPYAEKKIKLRKALLISVSACIFLLIAAILNTVLEKTSDNTSAYSIENSDDFKSETPERKTPREIIMEQRDRDMRMYSALIIVLAIFASVGADILLVKCPECGKHIPFGLNPDRCRRCGKSFIENSQVK